MELDLFNAYDRAAMSAAGLVLNLALLLALQRSVDQSDEVFSKEHKRLSRMTLGPLLQAAKQEVEFSANSEEKLDEILKWRNWLIHGFAPDIIRYIAMKDGTQTLEHNLMELDRFFWSASELFWEAMAERSEARGISQELIQTMVEATFSANIELNNGLQGIAAPHLEEDRDRSCHITS